MKKDCSQAYHRYHIETKKTPNIIPHPHRFQVKVKRLKLAKLLITELFHYRGNIEVVSSRPCMYGVFSGPIGGFAPREQLCVGCLRCTTQYPEMVEILPNPERSQLGDSYFTTEHVNAVIYEAETGRIPIRGAGYRGKFGGEGWDGMWTDMSEIVRPTRDGIHGREFISTKVDIGAKLAFLELNEQQAPIDTPPIFSIPIPFLFDAPPELNQSNQSLCHILSETAHEIQTFTIIPSESIIKFSLKGSHIIPLLSPCDFEEFKKLKFDPLMIEMLTWDEAIYQSIQSNFPNTLIILRADFESDILAYYRSGVRLFHFTANYHGRGKSGKFVLDLIRDVHLTFVQEQCRDEVTLIGSGGLIAAEHISKGIICGLDAIAIDTSVMVALQAKFEGSCTNRLESRFQLPTQITTTWGRQRLKNLASSWHEQILEILGAMGIREVRRMRGEMGRAMFQKDLENEVFTGIKGYETR